MCEFNYLEKSLNMVKNENNNIRLIDLFNNTHVNNKLNCYNSKDTNDNILSKKRKRDNEYDNFFLLNNSIDEEVEENESIDNNNIDEELLHLINKTPTFNKKQFGELQNNKNKEYVKKFQKCPICFTQRYQSYFLKYSISKCLHIICNICWTQILMKKNECPICRRTVNFSDLKIIIIEE